MDTMPDIWFAASNKASKLGFVPQFQPTNIFYFNKPDFQPLNEQL